MQKITTPLQHAAIGMLNSYSELCTHAVTLTMKQTLWIKTPRGRACIKLTPENASRNLRHALNRINRRFYGNGYKRKPEQYRLLVIATLEGKNTDKRLHYHLQIGHLPANTTTDELHTAIADAWGVTDFADRQIDVQALYGTNWLTYITKEIGNADTDCVDWQNVCVPDCLRKN